MTRKKSIPMTPDPQTTPDPRDAEPIDEEPMDASRLTLEEAVTKEDAQDDERHEQGGQVPDDGGRGERNYSEQFATMQDEDRREFAYEDPVDPAGNPRSLDFPDDDPRDPDRLDRRPPDPEVEQAEAPGAPIQRRGARQPRGKPGR